MGPVLNKCSLLNKLLVLRLPIGKRKRNVKSGNSWREANLKACYWLQTDKVITSWVMEKKASQPTTFPTCQEPEITQAWWSECYSSPSLLSCKYHSAKWPEIRTAPYIYKLNHPAQHFCTFHTQLPLSHSCSINAYWIMAAFIQCCRSSTSFHQVPG